jgi:hypothetical protein
LAIEHARSRADPALIPLLLGTIAHPHASSGPHRARDEDPVAELLAQIGDGGRTPIARMLAAAWREALVAVATGVLRRTPAPESAR